MPDDVRTILGAVMAIYAIIAAGVVLRKVNWLTEEADRSLIALVVQLLMPCLILETTLGNPRLLDPRNVLWPPALGLMVVVLGFAAALAWAAGAGKWAGLADPRQRRTFAFTVGIYNYSYIPIPIVALLFRGDEGTLGVLLVHAIGVELVLWTLGIVVLSGAISAGAWRKLVNAPSLTIVASLLLNFLGLDRHVPSFALQAVGMLGRCAIPIALLLVGATMADHVGELGLRTGKRVILAACALRLALLPPAILLLTWLLPISVELRRVMVVEAAMPAAVFPIVVARHYQGDPPTAIRVVVGTSVLGLVTIPLWIRFGLWWMGL